MSSSAYSTTEDTIAELHDALASISDEERKYVLTRSYPLFAAYYFGLTMEDFMSDMVEFTDQNQRSVILLPAGHSKSSTFSRYNLIRHICWNKNVRAQLIMSVYDDAEEYCKNIENELTENQLLIDDYGPFYNAKDWKGDGFTVIGRQHNDPKPTLRIFGAGGKAPNWTLKGQGCDLVVMDDVVTEDTASAPESRKRQSNWFRMAVQRNPRPMWPIDPRSPYGMKVPNGIDWPTDAPYNPRHGSLIPYGQIIVPGTRFNPYDLYQDLIDDKTYEVMHLDVWAEKVDGEWESDPTETKPLWKFMWTNEALYAERESDLRAFNCRMRNDPIDEAAITFKREWFDGDEEYEGCYDSTRSYGELPKDEKGQPLDLYKVLGFDPASGEATRFAAWPTWTLLGFPRGGDPETDVRYVLDSYRAQMGVELLIDIMLDGNMSIPHPGFYAKYKYDLCKVEKNGFANLMLSHDRITRAKQRGVLIEAHITNRNKLDPVMGVKSMAAAIKGGLFSFPFKAEEDRKRTKAMVDQFVYFSFDRAGRRKSLTDYPMSTWFAELAVRKTRETMKPYRHPTSPYSVVNPYYARSKSDSKSVAKLVGR